MRHNLKVRYYLSQTKCSTLPHFPSFPQTTMSLATEFLIDYIERAEQTQADFARLAGMTPTNLTEILKGSVKIGARNIDGLLRAITSGAERARFIHAHLNDQIPSDLADSVTVHITQQAEPGMVMEGGNEEAQLEAELIAAYRALTTLTYKRRVVRFLRQLKRDADLRDLFQRIMGYVDDDITTQRERDSQDAKQIYDAHKDKPTEGLPGQLANRGRKKA